MPSVPPARLPTPPTPGDRERHLSALVERLAHLAIDLNTIAARLNTLASDLTHAIPPTPGE